MLKNVAAVLLMISMSAGSAQARLLGSSSLTHAHFPTCSEGLVESICVCRAAHGSVRQQLCRSGRYCHLQAVRLWHALRMSNTSASVAPSVSTRIRYLVNKTGRVSTRGLKV